MIELEKSTSDTDESDDDYEIDRQGYEDGGIEGNSPHRHLKEYRLKAPRKGT